MSTTDPVELLAKDACQILVNLSADEKAAELLLKSSPRNLDGTGLIQLCLKNILDSNSSLSDIYSMILSNLTRPDTLVEEVIEELISNSSEALEILIACFTKPDFNKQNQNLDHLASVFSNITQSSKGRHLICEKDSRLVHRLLPFISYEKSLTRRQGIAGMLKNICFDTSLHEWLFGEDINSLPIIMLPLAGPEQFDDETNDKFPIELQVNLFEMS